MRKLAPMIILSSFAAFATTHVLAGDDKHASTDKQGNPTVSANKTGAKDLSYSDKSNTAKGTNAKMNDSKVAAANGSTTADTSSQNMGEPKTEAAKPYDEDNKQVDDKDKSDKPMKKKTAKAKADKVDKDAKVADASTGATASGNAAGVAASADTTATASANNPPLNVTKAEEAKSTTGKSAGQ